MAENKGNRNGTTRRGFLGAIGAAAAATALPGVAIPATGRLDTKSWPQAAAGWHAAQKALIERFRPAYFAELQRFAEELRPAFASGELRGFRDEDEKGYDARQAGEEEYTTPDQKIEDLCAERFGLEIENVRGRRVGDEAMANLILAVSPTAAAGHWAADGGWLHPAGRAACCAAWDLTAVARAMGLYEATPDECPDLDETRWAEDLA
jgi:hypothetical protein